MNVAIIITHEARFVQDVIRICCTIKEISIRRHDEFVLKDWKFLVIPRFMVPDRIRGLRPGRIVCFDTWLNRQTITKVFAQMMIDSPAIDYIDEYDELKRLVLEISAPQAEDKTQRSR